MECMFTCITVWINDFLSGFIWIFLVQGPPLQSYKSKLALTDRNIKYVSQVLFQGGLRIVRLDIFWNYHQFLWNTYCLPPIGPDASHLQFQMVFASFFSNFCLIFFWFWPYMNKQLLRITACWIMPTLCLIFAVNYKILPSLQK
jgi:hypothetical protein